MTTGRRERVLWTAVILGAAASAIVCSLVATQSLVLGAPAAGWFYGYQQVFSPRFPGVFAVACAAGTLLWLPAPRPGLDEWSRLLAWWAVRPRRSGCYDPSRPHARRLFTSDSANGLYGFAQQRAGDL